MSSVYGNNRIRKGPSSSRGQQERVDPIGGAGPGEVT